MAFFFNGQSGPSCAMWEPSEAPRGRVNGLNDSGQVVGSATTTNDAATHAFLYTDGLPLHDLGTLGGNFSSAEAINNCGQIVGTLSTRT